MRKEFDEGEIGGKLRKWQRKVEEGVQEVRSYIGRNFSAKHEGYLNTRFEGISGAHNEMLEEFSRMASIFRRITGVEMLVREKSNREDERMEKWEVI